MIHSIMYTTLCLIPIHFYLWGFLIKFPSSTLIVVCYIKFFAVTLHLMSCMEMHV